MDCARLLNVDPRSVRAWALGERSVPGPAIAALEFMFIIEDLPVPEGWEKVQALKKQRAHARRRRHARSA